MTPRPPIRARKAAARPKATARGWVFLQKRTNRICGDRIYSTRRAADDDRLQTCSEASPCSSKCHPIVRVRIVEQ